jgi:hypothetical protein
VPKGTGRASTASAVQRATSTTEVALLRTQRARNGTMDKPEWPRMQLRVGADLVHAGNGLFFFPSNLTRLSLTASDKMRAGEPALDAQIRSDVLPCSSLCSSLLATAIPCSLSYWLFAQLSCTTVLPNLVVHHIPATQTPSSPAQSSQSTFAPTDRHFLYPMHSFLSSFPYSPSARPPLRLKRETLSNLHVPLLARDRQ